MRENRQLTTTKNDEFYVMDALSRPVTRNADTFAYNIRSEVAAATIGGNHEEHAYDNIGNSVFAAFNGVSNTYTVNNLNQYTSVGRVAPNAPPTSPTYDADGNMTAFGPWTYTYDSNSRLVDVSSSGVLLVTNIYDAKGRRVKKVTQNGTSTYIYDDWNLIYERVDHAAGGVDEFHYVWGKDLSGTLQGAGGVGGLLYVKINGSIYVPHADAYGNIMRYTDTAGNVVAEYTYDAFGRTIAQTGPLADLFRHRFSTKYFDVETGMYYYGYRFYSPILWRWLNRDPIGERGSINVYSFCRNNSLCRYDRNGQAFSNFTDPGGGWSFWVEKSPTDDDFLVRAKYTLTRNQRCSCEKVEVDRYVRKILGIGNKYGSYGLDHSGERVSSLDDPYSGYAEGDTPDGQSLFFYRMPWTQSFKFVARCVKGQMDGQVLSTIEKKFKTTGHWFGQPYTGSFVE